MLFDGNPAGWHVILGDNSTGKSTLVRSIALALIGEQEARAIGAEWDDWLSRDKDRARIHLSMIFDRKVDLLTTGGRPVKNAGLLPVIKLSRAKSPKGAFVELEGDSDAGSVDPARYLWGRGFGWFSCGFGPFRRFYGGDEARAVRIHSSTSRLSRHLTLFGEDYALNEAVLWLLELNQKVKFNEIPATIIEWVVQFVNKNELLPRGASIQEITRDTIIVNDHNGIPVPLRDMSDGVRSILSLTLELLRNLLSCYKPEEVFKNSQADTFTIDLPGVVLIDEIDAHLHPSWQATVGEWFIKFFPAIQFIVTTHSPIICRSARDGTIWQLRPQDFLSRSNESQCVRLQGETFARLVNGDLAEAAGTGVFGRGVVESPHSAVLLKELAHLNQLALKGPLAEAQISRRYELREMFPTRSGLLEEFL